MIKVGFIIGSTRPGRHTQSIAEWAFKVAKTRQDANYELIDITDFKLPLLDEPIPPAMGQYEKLHTKIWAAKIESLDAFVFVTPEYNHGPSGALKNAIDFLYKEWNNKAAGFVSFGSGHGIRAVEQLRQIMAELQIADVRTQVTFSLFHDFENGNSLKASEHHVKSTHTMLDQLVTWAIALKTVRENKIENLMLKSNVPRDERVTH